MTSGASMARQSAKTTFETEGRLWLRQAISEQDLQLFDQAAASQTKAGARLARSTTLTHALRADGTLLRALRWIDAETHPVRTVAFNKSEATNWGVPWHQDRVIAVKDRANLPGYTNWTQKSGIWHCEPPQQVLENMLFVRVHLDDTDEDNGAMALALGSHKKGIITAAAAETEAGKLPIEICQAQRGDVLVLKMLTLHCSKPARVPSGRRVLRVDCASFALPPPLEWQDLGAQRL
ncbi:phytanoyl-CoA dioxygenase family protein [Yoonia sp. BS5-3]|uniref:Phytanoyl-CoA dioxygenase family protein n=1 Tax=Yoonia phaeophyticola TaxID=3137369 RepID=A0ABZ2V2J5_9RHOB